MPFYSTEGRHLVAQLKEVIAAKKEMIAYLEASTRLRVNPDSTDHARELDGIKAQEAELLRQLELYKSIKGVHVRTS